MAETATRRRRPLRLEGVKDIHEPSTARAHARRWNRMARELDTEGAPTVAKEKARELRQRAKAAHDWARATEDAGVRTERAAEKVVPIRKAAPRSGGFKARRALRNAGVRTVTAADRVAARATPSSTRRALRRADALPDFGGGPTGVGGLLIYAFASIVGLALLENMLSGRGPAGVGAVLSGLVGGLKRLVAADDPLIGQGTVTAAQIQGAGGSAVGAAAAAGGYVNPLGGLHFSLGRTDQGLDIEAGPGGVGKPIGAIGNAQIVAISRHYQGFGQYVAYRLLDGPQKGRVIYVGHSRVANLSIGQKISAGGTVAYVQGYNASPGHIEMGYASPTDPYSTLARKAGHVNPSSHHSPEGAAFAAWWRLLTGGR